MCYVLKTKSRISMFIPDGCVNETRFENILPYLLTIQKHALSIVLPMVNKTKVS